MTKVSRSLAVLLVVGLCLAMSAVVAVPDARAEADAWRADARGLGLELLVLGQDALTIRGAESRAVLVDEGDAAGRGVGFEGQDASISEVDLTQGQARDPESGQNCATPALPAPLDGLPAGLGCSSAEATAVEGDNEATATGALATIDLDGNALSALVDFLIDNVGAEAAAALDSAIAPLEELSGPLVDPVVDALAPQCNAALEPIVTGGDPIFGALDEVVANDPTGITSGSAGDIIDALEALTQQLPEACQSLLNVLSNPPSIEVVLDDIADALRDALNGLDLVSITLGSTTSTVETDPDVVRSNALATGTTVELPSLAAVVDALEDLVPDLVGALVDQVAEQVADSLEDVIPAVTGLVDEVLTQLMLPDLLDTDEPLLTIEAGRARVDALLDRTDVTTSSDANASAAVLTLSSAFATLVGEENTTITIPGGDSMTIAEDTPIESTISVLATEEITLEPDSEDFTLSGRRAGGVELELLQGEEFMGGIVLTLAGAQAVVGGDEAASPTPTSSPTPSPTPTSPPLPTTGGGLALLGLLALGGAVAVGRRRS